MKLLPKHGRRGFTLIEVLIGVLMLGAFFGSLFMVVSQGTSAARNAMAHQTVESLARRTLDRMAHELASAGAGTLNPNPTQPFGSDHVTFQAISGYSAGVTQWETPASFSLELEDGEQDNGTDDNGNGLKDEAGLSIERKGGMLFLRLSLERRDLRGETTVRTVQTSVRLRN